MKSIARIEYAIVVETDDLGDVGYQNHESPDSEYWGTVSLKMRAMKRDSSNNKGPQYYRHVAVLQHDLIGHKFGHPHTIRVGDVVALLCIEDQLPLVLGTVYSQQMKPLCRAPCDNQSNNIDEKYSEVDKWCQWKRPIYTIDDNGLPAVIRYQDPEKPSCHKIFHSNRDQMTLYDFCVEGDKDPDCSECKTIDYVKRNKNTWIKSYSHDTGSCQSPPKRWELHTYDGSCIRFENETGQSVVYSEGQGHIRVENRIKEELPGGHINFQGSKVTGNGTIDMHSGNTDPGLPLSSETLGARVAVLAEDDTYTDAVGEIAAEVIYLPKGNYLRLYKDGTIKLHAGETSTNITMTDDTITLSGETVQVDCTDFIVNCTDLVVNASDDVTINAGGIIYLNADQIFQKDDLIHQYTPP